MQSLLGGGYLRGLRRINCFWNFLKVIRFLKQKERVSKRDTTLSLRVVRKVESMYGLMEMTVDVFSPL